VLQNIYKHHYQQCQGVIPGRKREIYPPNNLDVSLQQFENFGNSKKEKSRLRLAKKLVILVISREKKVSLKTVFNLR